MKAEFYDSESLAYLGRPAVAQKTFGGDDAGWQPVLLAGETAAVTEKIRLAMVGGGPGAFIGAVHRLAASMTDRFDLQAGAFCRDAEASRAFGRELGLASARSYGSYQELLASEAALPPAERVQCLAIVTPNDSHAEIAIAALAAGFHVLCDKPAAGCLEDALRMQAAVEASGQLFGLTHTYTGYPLVMEARDRIAAGALGELRRVHVSYLQDWLSREEDTRGSKQASWRNDPARSGESGAFADIGSHAFNLVEFMSGESITAVAAQLRSVVPGRTIDDDGSALFSLSGGAQGLLAASQVCTGSVNALKIELFGTEGAMSWQQEQPNTLVLKRRAEPDTILHANMDYLGASARAVARTPGGHPEGYLEAFANIYQAFAEAVTAFPEAPQPRGFASIDDGVAALRFIRAARLSSQQGSAWTELAAIERKSL